ncbi:hypothetical protein MTBGP_03420 [Moorella thermoacetica]|uniref:hypothetical protein n=1 Tax=Neomoorella thermoacetica TaxID=1525 RepID=UPI0030CC227C
MLWLKLKKVFLLMAALLFAIPAPAGAGTPGWQEINGRQVYGYWLDLGGTPAFIVCDPSTGQPLRDAGGRGSAWINRGEWAEEEVQVFDGYDTEAWADLNKGKQEINLEPVAGPFCLNGLSSDSSNGAQTGANTPWPYQIAEDRTAAIKLRNNTEAAIDVNGGDNNRDNGGFTIPPRSEIWVKTPWPAVTNTGTMADAAQLSETLDVEYHMTAIHDPDAYTETIPAYSMPVNILCADVGAALGYDIPPRQGAIRDRGNSYDGNREGPFYAYYWGGKYVEPTVNIPWIDLWRTWTRDEDVEAGIRLWREDWRRWILEDLPWSPSGPSLLVAEPAFAQKYTFIPSPDNPNKGELRTDVVPGYRISAPGAESITGDVGITSPRTVSLTLKNGTPFITSGSFGAVIIDYTYWGYNPETNDYEEFSEREVKEVPYVTLPPFGSTSMEFSLPYPNWMDVNITEAWFTRAYYQSRPYKYVTTNGTFDTRDYVNRGNYILGYSPAFGVRTGVYPAEFFPAFPRVPDKVSFSFWYNTGSGTRWQIGPAS